MDNCPPYYQPIVSYESTLRLDLYRAAGKLFEERKYEESFRALLGSINEDAARKGEKEKSRWEVPHGSLVLEIRLDPGGWVELRAPFVKLSPERRAAPLRQTVELNTYNLRLSKLLLDGDGLGFFCRVPLELAEPGKMYGIISEICFCGDSYDDEYISRFGALPLREKQVTALPPAQIEQAWRLYQGILQEAKKYSEYYASRRWHGFNFEILGIALYRVDHAVAPQGYLRTRLERSVNHVWDERSAEEIAGILTRDLDEFVRLERSSFDGDFYRADFFVSSKKFAEVQACKKQMSRRWEWAQEDRAHGNWQGVVICYLFSAYNLLYSFFLPPHLQQELVGTLDAMGGLSWEEAGKLAWSSFQKMMDPAYE